MVKELTIVKPLIPFLSRPKETLHLSFIAKEIGEPHPSVRLWLANLEALGLLRKSSKGRLTLFALNYEQELLLEYLVLTEKIQLIRRAEQELLLKEIILFIHTSLSENSNAVLFGSAVVSIKNASDIDILVTGKYNQKAFSVFSKKINKQIHIINLRSLANVSLSLKNEIIKKHLILKGSEDILRWLFW